jgi:hypothetical protein
MALYESGAWSGSTANSALAFKGAYSTTFSFVHATISSGQVGAISLASTTCDIMPGDIFQVEVTPTVATAVQAGVRTSTAATSRVTIVMANPGSTATSTFSGTGRITWIDLT